MKLESSQRGNLCDTVLRADKLSFYFCVLRVACCDVAEKTCFYEAHGTETSMMFQVAVEAEATYVTAYT